MKHIFIFVLIFFIGVGCKKLSVDNEDPVVEVFLINGSESIAQFTAGSALNVEMYITDNEELLEAVLRLDNISNPNLPDALKRPYFNIFADIESKQWGETVTISTDETLRAGRYRLMLQVVDANGNSNSAVMEFTVNNPAFEPRVEIDGFLPPAVDGVVYLNPGDSMVTQGWILDDAGLAWFSVKLTGPQNLYNEIIEISEPDFTGYSFAWLANVFTNENTLAGDYLYSIEVLNNEGHMVYHTQTVVINP